MCLKSGQTEKTSQFSHLILTNQSQYLLNGIVFLHLKVTKMYS